MQRDWDERARENARYYVATGKEDWTDEEFFASGEPDRKGRDPHRHDQHLPGQGSEADACARNRMRRRPRHARAFRAVRRGPRRRRQRRNGAARPATAWPTVPTRSYTRTTARICPSSATVEFDFAFSTIVFQHIPSRDVIEIVRSRSEPAAATRRSVQIPGAGRQLASDLRLRTHGSAFRSPMRTR